MLPRKYRLPLRFNRNSLEAEAKTIHFPLFTLSYSSSTEDQPIRFAFIISKKISKSAVIRNSLKRKVVAILHPLLPRLISGYDVVFYVKKNLLTADSTMIHNQLTQALQRANLLEQ